MIFTIIYFVSAGIFSLIVYAFEYASTDDEDSAMGAAIASFIFFPIFAPIAIIYKTISGIVFLIKKMIDKTVHKEKRLYEKQKRLEREIEKMHNDY